jgi:hypothetical protein
LQQLLGAEMFLGVEGAVDDGPALRRHAQFLALKEIDEFLLGDATFHCHERRLTLEP